MAEEEDVPKRPAPDELVRRVAKARIADKLFASGEQIRIGRYQLLEKVGEGGMSVVWGAWDPELERRVAIKLVKATTGSTRERILAEGQALAKLSHPNVVPVFDVGVVDERVYLVMEWVRGKTLREWSETGERSDSQTLALYRAAAMGLIAAHEAGLVHRDFKPDNAVVGDDGRVRVLDFGLASSEVRGSPEEVSPTAGTPRYMAPEQASGGEITAAADQYSFGVSLREAFGAHGMPAWIAAIIARATAKSPAQRFGSMAALVAALDRDPRRVWKRRFLVGGVVAMAAGAFAIGTLRGEADPCSGSEAEIATTWSGARAEAVKRAAGIDGSAAVALFDAWAKRWARERETVCRAGQGSWSAQLFDRGLSCLSSRRQRFASMIELFESPTHGHGVDLLQNRLPDPQPCSDPAYLQAAVAPPTEPVRAAAVRALQTNMARTLSIAQIGEVKRASALAAVLVQQAATLGYAPLIPQAHVLSGSIAVFRGDWEKATTDLHEAYFGARAAGDPETAANAAATLTVVFLNTSRDKDAREWARFASAEAAISNDPAIQSLAAQAQTMVAHDTTDVDNVVAYADRYLALAKSRGVPLAIPLMERGRALHLVGRLDDALADLDAAASDAESRAVLELSSMIATERSLVLIELRRTEDALAAARKALSVVEGKIDPNSQTILGALGALAVALGRSGLDDEALAVFARSIAIERATEGERSYNVASDLHNRAELLSRMRRFEEAFTSWDEARSIFAEIDGPTSLDVAKVELGYSLALIRSGQRDRIASHAEVAHAAFASTPEHVGFAMAQIALGVARAEQKQWPAAKQLLEEGIAHLDIPQWHASGELSLAFVNAATGNPARARELATSALAALRADVEMQHEADEAQAFLARVR